MEKINDSRPDSLTELFCEKKREFENGMDRFEAEESELGSKN